MVSPSLLRSPPSTFVSRSAVYYRAVRLLAQRRHWCSAPRCRNVKYSSDECHGLTVESKRACLRAASCNSNNNGLSNQTSTVRTHHTLRPLCQSHLRPHSQPQSQTQWSPHWRPPPSHPTCCTPRPFSTSFRRYLPTIRQLLGLNRKLPSSSSPASAAAAAAQLSASDLPPRLPLEGGDLFLFPRIAAKAVNEPRLRCTELDENGNVTLVNGEFKKTELIAKYGLLPRDLRKIDSSVLPNILVRHSAILISLLHLHVLIKADRVLVFDVYGSADSYTQSVFMYDLEGKLRHKERNGSQSALPYEFRALEAVLVSVTAGLEAEFEGVREPVVQVLRALEEDIDRGKLRQLLVYSKRLSTFEQKARLVRDAINTLLDADDDLTAMYLTERKNGKEREEDDHQEVEMLLESYHKICDEIVQASGNLVTNIRNTEEIVKAILDANRNSLMLLDLKFSIGTLGLAFGTLCSSFYGMNLKNFIEESDLGFAGVTGACFTASALVCWFALQKLRKVQRVRMWGEGGIDRHSGSQLVNHLHAAHHAAHAHAHARAINAQRQNASLLSWRLDMVDTPAAKSAGDGRLERAKRRQASGLEAATAGLQAQGSDAARSAGGGQQKQEVVQWRA